MPTLASLSLPPPRNWQDFEDLCLDLFRRQWNDPEAQKNGRTGQPQAGVDVFGRDGGLKWVGVQCKVKSGSLGLSRQEIQAEVEKARRFRPRLSRYIIATTAASDAVAQQEARNITASQVASGAFSVVILSWDDILLQLDEYPSLVDKHYPQLRERPLTSLGDGQAHAGHRVMRGGPLPALSPADETFNALWHLDYDPIRLALTCDRDELWGMLTREVDERRHCAIFVMGARRQAHGFFLSRIRHYYPHHPPRSICSVSWALRPCYREDFYAALAAALSCPEDRLVASLREALVGQNLVLVHDLCEQDFADEAVFSYYTQWLPELLGAVKRTTRGGSPSGYVKLVQALVWTAPSPPRRAGASEGRGTSRVETAAFQDEASVRGTLHRIWSKKNPNLPIMTLEPPLGPITREHLHDVQERLAGGGPPNFVSELLAGHPDAEELLNRLVDRLRRQSPPKEGGH